MFNMKLVVTGSMPTGRRLNEMDGLLPPPEKNALCIFLARWIWVSEALEIARFAETLDLSCQLRALVSTMSTRYLLKNLSRIPPGLKKAAKSRSCTSRSEPLSNG